MRPDFPYQLYLVMSEADCRGRDFLQVAEQAIKGGVDLIQLREKNAGASLFKQRAERLMALTDYYKVPLIINDNLAIAMQVNAAGVHVGNNDLRPTEVLSQWQGPSKIIGYSVEYLEQLSNPEIPVAGYLGISPVFSTATKTDTVTEWGLEGIKRIRSLTSKPLVAIGNMNQTNARAVIAAGADCIAVVSAICAADNPQKAAEQIKNEILK